MLYNYARHKHSSLLFCIDVCSNRMELLIQDYLFPAKVLSISWDSMRYEMIIILILRLL